MRFYLKNASNALGTTSPFTPGVNILGEHMSSKDLENSSMDQVRELLMGSHMKDMETRMKRQEKTFLREIATLRDNMEKRVDSLENFMKNEFDSFLRRLQEEKEERSSSLKNENRERTEAISSEQKERTRALKEAEKERKQSFERLDKNLAAKEQETERKFASISSSLDAAEKGLRELLLSEKTRITQTLEERYQEVMEQIANTASQIRQDLVSRSSLSAMFAEAAVRFSEHESENLQEYEEQDSEGILPAETKGSNES